MSACRLDLGADRLWKSPSMLLAMDQKCYRAGEGQVGKRPIGSTHSRLLETRCFWPLSRSPCSHPDQVFRVLTSLSLVMRMHSLLQAQPDLLRTWSSAFPQDLACLHCAHSSYPHLNSGLFPLLPCPCSGHRNHFCSPFCDRPGLCHGPLSSGGARGVGWLAKSREA